MDIEVVKSEKDLIEFKLIGETHTLSNMLVQELLGIKGVEFSSYKLEHPSDNHSVIVVKTDGKLKPDAAVKKAVEALEKTIKDFSAAFSKAK